MDFVAVGFGGGVEAGVEVGVGFGGVEDADGGGEEAVDGAAEVVDGDAVVEGEGGYLGEGVNAGVGTTGAGDVDVFAVHIAEDFFEDALDGDEIGLVLPAVEIGTVIGKSDSDATRHGEFCGLVSGEMGGRAASEPGGLRIFRSSKIIPLDFVRAEFADDIELVGGFDAFGDDAEVEFAGHGDDGADEGGSAEGGIDLFHEGAVDFEAVDGELLEVAEGGVAGAEVVDGEGDAGAAKFVHFADALVAVAEEGAFGEFEFEEVVGEAEAGEGLEDGIDEVRP